MASASATEMLPAAVAVLAGGRPASAALLASCTHPGWAAVAVRDLRALLSDHLHCERKAAENALSLVRRYPYRAASVDTLARLAHEETSHVVQVAALITRRGWVPRTDLPNNYARKLLAEVRGREPGRLLDSLLVAAFIEARSHERLDLLARVFQAQEDACARSPVQSGGGGGGAGELASFYRALATAEERHADVFLELAAPLVSGAELASRVAYFSECEAEVLAEQPFVSRVH